MIKDYLFVGFGLLLISTFLSFYTLAEGVTETTITHSTQYATAVDCGFQGIPIENCMNQSTEELEEDMDDSLDEYLKLLNETKEELSNEIESLS